MKVASGRAWERMVAITTANKLSRQLKHHEAIFAKASSPKDYERMISSAKLLVSEYQPVLNKLSGLERQMCERNKFLIYNPHNILETGPKMSKEDWLDIFSAIKEGRLTSWIRLRPETDAFFGGIRSFIKNYCELSLPDKQGTLMQSIRSAVMPKEINVIGPARGLGLRVEELGKTFFIKDLDLEEGQRYGFTSFLSWFPSRLSSGKRFTMGLNVSKAGSKDAPKQYFFVEEQGSFELYRPDTGFIFGKDPSNNLIF